MDKDYYGRLGVEETADPQQIKRAYYTLVKQYPPERFPEEYKALRAAYDVLSSEGKRAEYDRGRSLPADAAYLFDQAASLERLGRDGQAAEAYEQILRLHPGLTRAREALARSLEAQGKTGKAITVWEALCREAPENVGYACELAQAYDHRGWNKKAAAGYRRALELDSGNAECWVALINLHIASGNPEEGRSVCEQGLDALRERGVESVRLYAMAVMYYGQKNDTETAERYLGEIARILRAGGGRREHPEETVRFLLAVAGQLGKPGFARYIREMAATLPRIDDDLREELAEADRAAEVESIEEQGFDVLFHDLFATLLNECDCEDCRNDLMAMECHLLAKLEGYRPELLRLKKELPQLYAMHAEFFDELLRTREAEKLLYRRLKILSRKGLTPAGFDEEGDELAAPAEPVRRTEPKVGRNDPCPCGSGKKFKRCCGR